MSINILVLDPKMTGCCFEVSAASFARKPGREGLFDYSFQSLFCFECFHPYMR